jgi:hypothetical protein
VRLKVDSPGRLLGPLSGKSLSLSDRADRDILNLLSLKVFLLSSSSIISLLLSSIFYLLRYIFLSYISVDTILPKYTRELLYTALRVIVNLYLGLSCQINFPQDPNNRPKDIDIRTIDTARRVRRLRPAQEHRIARIAALHLHSARAGGLRSDEWRHPQSLLLHLYSYLKPVTRSSPLIRVARRSLHPLHGSER